MGLAVNFLGGADIELDGVRVSFPLQKAEIAVLYAAFGGPVTRARLTGLLWPDKDGDKARANLRNALYLIRSALPGHTEIDRRSFALKDFSTDVEVLDKIADPSVPLPALMFREPLEGLEAGDSDECEEWISAARTALVDRLAGWLRNRVSACYDQKLTEELGSSLEALLKLDPYDEDSALELMDVYRSMGLPTRAAELYRSYSARLEDKLGVAPSERARDYFKKITAGIMPENHLQPQNTAGGGHFWCRKRELASLLEALEDQSSRNTAAFVYGEAGIGKTALIEQAVSQLRGNGALILTARACAVGEAYPYSAWNNIMTQIGAALGERGKWPDARSQSVLSGVFPTFLADRRLNYNADVALLTERNPIVIGDMIAALVRELAKSGAVYMVFEDAHWFDVQSLQLLTAFIGAVSFPLRAIVSGRPESARVILAMLQNAAASASWRIAPIKLEPLRGDEVLQICAGTLPQAVLKERGGDFFIRESEGLPLLLFEMLHALAENPDSDCTNGLGGLVMDRLGEMKPVQRGLLETLAVFGAAAEPRQAAETMGADENSVRDAGEALISRGLLTEKEENGKAVWGFAHDRIRFCVYESISLARRQELHKRAAETLNRRWSPQKWDPQLSSLLRHHYQRSGQREMELKQYIRELIFDITLNHDLYPVVTDEVLLSCYTPFSSRAETEAKISQTMNILDEMRLGRGAESGEFARLEAACFELAGGYHVSWGEYDKSGVYIDAAVKLAKTFNLTETHVHCLKHLCYMHIQTENAPRLLATARELIRLAKTADMPHYLATAVRYVGMAQFMLKDASAEKTFRHSIRLFEKLALTGRRYTLGILVNMCYLGELCQLRGDLQAALEYFTKCTDKCEELDLYWGRSCFHARAAGAALDLCDLPLMYAHIDKAVSMFENCRGGRCDSTLYSLKAIADAERGNAEGAKKALARAEIFLGSVARKQWAATQLMAKAWTEMKTGGFGARTNEDAAQAAALFRQCGWTNRAELIEKKFLRG